MRRLVLKAASVASLLLCAAMAMLWVRSHWRADAVYRTVFFHPAWFQGPGDEQDMTLGVDSIDGTLSIEWRGYSATYIPAGRMLSVRWSYQSEPYVGPFTTAGVLEAEGMRHGISIGPYGVGYGDWAYGWRCHLIVPHWVVALFTFVLPAVWLRSWGARRLRRSQGRCGSCGYNLRATPERCPECGAVAPPKQGARA